MKPNIMINVHTVRVTAFCFFFARSAFTSSTDAGFGAGSDADSIAILDSLWRGTVVRSCEALRFRWYSGNGLAGGGGRLGREGWKRLVGGPGD